jgi:hypothetical protein
MKFKKINIYIYIYIKPQWRNRIARFPSKEEVAGSSPAWGVIFIYKNEIIQID